MSNSDFPIPLPGELLMLRSLFAVLFTVALVPLCAQSQDKEKPKTTEQKLIGKWKLEKTESDLPEGAKATVEIKKGGDMVILIEIGDMKIKMEGTWKLDGDKKIVTIIKLPDGKEKKETSTIDKLTDDELVMIDEKDKKDELKRIKD